jgi:predicted dehydrogenase
LGEANLQKLALVGLNNSHPYVFAGYVNGGDRDVFLRNSPAWTHPLFPDKDWEPMVGEGEWTFGTAWSRNREFAREVMEAVRVPDLADTLEEAAENCEGAFVCDMWGEYHKQQALPFLERGKPVFVDKPLAESTADAMAMVQAAQANGTVISSCSAMRYDKGLMELVEELEGSLGRPRIVTVCSPCYQDLARYSVHGIEIMSAVVNRQPVLRVRNVGQSTRKHLLLLDFADGTCGVIHSWENHAYSVTVTADNGQRAVLLEDQDCHLTMMEAALESFTSGNPVVDYGNALEVVRIIEAGNVSRLQGGEVVELSGN